MKQHVMLALALLLLAIPAFADDAAVNAESDTDLLHPLRDALPVLERSLERNRDELLHNAQIAREGGKEMAERAKERIGDHIADLRKRCSESNNVDCLEALDAKLPRPLPANIRGPAMDAAMHMDMRARLREDLHAQFPGFADHERPRPMPVHILEQVRIRIEHAQGQFEEAKDNYHKRLDTIKAMHKRVVECKSKDDVSCKETRADVRIESRAALINAADATLASLEKAKATIEAEQDLFSESANRSVAMLDASITAVTDAKGKASALSENSTSEEIRASLDTLRKTIHDVTQTIRDQERSVINARIAGVLVRTAQMEAKLDAAVARAIEDGKDVTAVDATIDIFHTQLASAKANYDVMLKTRDKTKLEIIKQDLARARESLKGILADLAALGISVNLAAEVSA
ncbi:hypothetical protein HY641_01655 [Candidatus Woesearchaeota archaeon]|nr:hypothetical protein [Candidatus Woesearchaeota archaeon]